MSINETIFLDKIINENQSHRSSQNSNSRIVQCTFCKEEFALEQGTILFDGDWFHEKCLIIVGQRISHQLAFVK